MKLEDYLKNASVLVIPLKKEGSYIAEVRGRSPEDEVLYFDIELEACTTPQLLKDTLQAKLEEILSCKYHYESEDFDEEELHYDGGFFR